VLEASFFLSPPFSSHGRKHGGVDEFVSALETLTEDGIMHLKRSWGVERSDWHIVIRDEENESENPENSRVLLA
jgi:hypothetical protein